MAVVTRQTGGPAAALAWLDKALAANQTSHVFDDKTTANRLAFRAELQSALGHPEAARQDLAAAFALNPAESLAHQALGDLETRLGHFGQALAAYDKALALKPGDEAALNARSAVLDKLKTQPRTLELLGQAEGLYAKRDYPAVMKLANQMLKLDPDNLQALMLRAKSNYRGGEITEQAAQDLQKVLSIDAAHADALFGMAVVHKHHGEPAKALESLSAALASNQANPVFDDKKLANLLAFKAEIEALVGHPQQAQQDVEKSLQLNPKQTLALVNQAKLQARLGDFTQALAAVDKALAARPGDKDLLELKAQVQERRQHHPEVKSLVEQAKTLYAEKHFPRVLALMNQALALEPFNTEALMLRAKSDYRDGHITERAAADLQKVLSVDAKHADALFGMAVAHKFHGDNDKALACLNAALDANQTSRAFDDRRVANLLAFRAEVQTLLGHPEAALRDISESLRLNPKQTLALVNQGRIYGRLGQFEKAIAAFDQVLAVRPDDKEIQAYKAKAQDRLQHRGQTQELVDKAQAHYEKKQYAQARKAASQALELDPNHVSALILRSKATYRGKGFNTEAENDLREVLRLDAGNADARFGLAIAARNHGKQAEALEQLDAALAAHQAKPVFDEKKLAVLHAVRGMVLAELGRPQEGLSEIGESLRLNPNEFMAHQYQGRILSRLEKFAEALAAFDKAAAIRPDDPGIQAGRAAVLRQQAALALEGT